MNKIESMKLACEYGTYKWEIYQIERWNDENSIPMAAMFHEEDARLLFDYLCDRYNIRFVLTNVRTGESQHG